MCQLLALNCAVPTAATFSFSGFAARGGLTDHHSDGWGIAFIDGPDVRLLTDLQPSARSDLAERIKRDAAKCLHTIAHLRKATRGAIRRENCHPFRRVLWERNWVFAHNGDLENYAPLPGPLYAPHGDTDSELAFCMLLEGLRVRFGRHEPEPEALFEALTALTSGISAHGVFNFVLSNGHAMFTYCSTHLHYVERTWPFSTARLIDTDASIDFTLHMSREDAVAVIATTPLTDNEAWARFAPGTLAMFVDGQLHGTRTLPVPPAVLVKARQPLERSSEAA